MTDKTYQDCYRCHGSGESKDGRSVCDVCKGARRFEIDPHELAVEQLRENGLEDR